jgi:tetratricopeptide (TPR) repeat protein
MKHLLAALFLLLCIWATPAAAAPAFPIYDLDVKLLPQDHRLEASGTMTIPPQPVPTSTLRLTLTSRMRDFKVAQVAPDGRALPVDVAPDPAKKGVYILKLPLGASSNAQSKLRVSYLGGEENGFVFSMEGPTYYAAGSNTAWYPQLGEDGRGTGTLRFHVPDGLIVTASGRRDDRAGQTAPTYAVDVPTHFSFIAGRFSVTHLPGPIPVTLYSLRGRSGSRDYLVRLQRVITGLSAMFGPYPYGTMTLAEIPRPQANDTGFDGVSTEGLVMLSDSSLDEPFSLPFFAHELSHQWWGNLVTSTGAKGNAMLDEALAQFGALQIVRQFEGDKAAERFRHSGYPGYNDNQSAAGYFKIAAAGLDHPLDSLPSGTFVTHELANSKGFIVLDLLSRTVGRDRFDAALQQIVREHAFSTLSWEQFLDAVQKYSPGDLGWFNRQWFERTGAPDLSSEWTQSGGTLRITVRQTTPAYRLRIPVQAVGTDGAKRLFAADVSGPATRLNLPVGFRVRSVEVDPDYEVLRWTPAFRARAQALAEVTRAYFLRSDNKMDEARAAYQRALRAAPAHDRFGVAFQAQKGLGTIAIIKGKWEEAKTHLLAAVSEPNPPERDLPWAYQALAQAAKNLKDAALLKRAVAGAVSADARLALPTGAGIAAERLLTDEGSKA